MDTAELNDRLIAIGDAVKRKGWVSVSINIYVHLGIFDRESGRLDPMISYQPSITTSTRDEYGVPTSHEFGIHSTNALDQAIAKLQEAADAMPTMATVIDRIEEAKAKLSTDELRLLGVR